MPVRGGLAGGPGERWGREARPRAERFRVGSGRGGGGRGRSAGWRGGARGGPAGGKGLSGEREADSTEGAAASDSEAGLGARGAVPGVELLAVRECPHVVVAHEVAAEHSAWALVGHEAPLDLQLGVRAQAQARHGRRLPGHPEQQQEQRRRRGPPTPGPERHRGRRGEERARGAGRGAQNGLGSAELGRRGTGLGARRRLQTWNRLPALPGRQQPPPSPAPRPQPTEGRSRGRAPGRACSARRRPAPRARRAGPPGERAGTSEGPAPSEESAGPRDRASARSWERKTFTAQPTHRSPPVPGTLQVQGHKGLLRGRGSNYPLLLSGRERNLDLKKKNSYKDAFYIEKRLKPFFRMFSPVFSCNT